MSSVVKSLTPIAAKALGTAVGGPVGGLVGGQIAGSLFGADRAREAAGVESGAIREGGEVSAEGIFPPFNRRRGKCGGNGGGVKWCFRTGSSSGGF